MIIVLAPSPPQGAVQLGVNIGRLASTVSISGELHSAK
jgi:hypothetical protein